MFSPCASLFQCFELGHNFLPVHRFSILLIFPHSPLFLSFFNPFIHVHLFCAASYPRMAKCILTLGRFDSYQDIDNNSNRSPSWTESPRERKDRVASFSRWWICICSFLTGKQVLINYFSWFIILLSLKFRIYLASSFRILVIGLECYHLNWTSFSLLSLSCLCRLPPIWMN